jgi:hypothetical protein
MEEKDIAFDIENIISEFCDGTLKSKKGQGLVFSLENAYFTNGENLKPQELAERIIDYIENLNK